MADLALTYTLTNGTLADADKVHQDLIDIRDWVNTNAIRKDGSVTMTAALSLVAASPTTDNHATRKLYVDNRPCGMASRATDSTIATATNTAITFTSETFDTDTMVDIAGAPTRVTFKTAGVFNVQGQLSFDGPNATGTRAAWISTSTGLRLGMQESGGQGAAGTRFALSGLFKAAVNDYVELYCYQTSGGNLLAVSSSGIPTTLSAVRVATG